MGYNVEWKVLNLTDFGLPQNRERIIFIASKNLSFDFSKIRTIKSPPLRDFLDTEGDFEYLNKYSLHVPSNRYIEYNSSSTKAFISKYRSTNNMEPQIYGYTGFDVTYYFASALQKYGTGFLNNIKEYNHRGIASKANYIQSASSKSGFENKFVVILKYQDYKLVKAN